MQQWQPRNFISYASFFIFENHNSPSLVGNPAVTKVTNAASSRSFAAAKASSIRPLWPLVMDDDIIRALFGLENRVLFDGLSANRDAAGVDEVGGKRRDDVVFFTAIARSGVRRRCM